MQSKSEIVRGISETMTKVMESLEAIDDSQFIAKPIPEKWSIAEEFDHILKSNVAIASALKRHPLLFRWKFGKANRPVRTYDQVFTRYNERLDGIQGAVAPSPFISQEGQSFDKQGMINHWKSTINKLSGRILKWSDNHLDKEIMPHPLLGKIIVREMLFFADFHTQHHGKSIAKKISDLSS